MAAFLSPRWFDAVNAAARDSDRVRRASRHTTLVIQQVVTDGPDGDQRYWLRVSGGWVEARPGEAVGADLTLTESYETAQAVRRGELGLEEAFFQGRIRIDGDVAALLTHGASLREVAVALGEAGGDGDGPGEAGGDGDDDGPG